MVLKRIPNDSNPNQSSICLAQRWHYCYLELEGELGGGNAVLCCPVRYRTFGSFPGLYPLEASSSALLTLTGVTSISKHCQMFLWRQNHPPVENHRSGVNKNQSFEVLFGKKEKTKQKSYLKPRG